VIVGIYIECGGSCRGGEARTTSASESMDFSAIKEKIFYGDLNVGKFTGGGGGLSRGGVKSRVN